MKKTIPKPVFEFWNGLLCIFPGSVAFRLRRGAVEEAALSHVTVFCFSTRQGRRQGILLSARLPAHLNRQRNGLEVFFLYAVHVDRVSSLTGIEFGRYGKLRVLAVA